MGPIDKSISCKAAQKVTIPQLFWGLNGQTAQKVWLLGHWQSTTSLLVGSQHYSHYTSAIPAYPPKDITSNKHLPLSSQKRHSFKKGGPRGIDCNGEISLCGACADAPGKLMVKFNSTSLQIQASCWLKSAQARSNYQRCTQLVHNNKTHAVVYLYSLYSVHTCTISVIQIHIVIELTSTKYQPYFILAPVSTPHIQTNESKYIISYNSPKP